MVNFENSWTATSGDKYIRYYPAVTVSGIWTTKLDNKICNSEVEMPEDVEDCLCRFQ